MISPLRSLGLPFLIVAIAVLVVGCGRKGDGIASSDGPALHKDVPPHGGTPVPLGDDYNLELVLDPAEGLLSGYVLDDEMEEFIRSPNHSVSIAVNVGGQTRDLILDAVANPATGESIGDTSLFQAKADWLRTFHSFEGRIVSITVRGTTFTGIKFRFPENNEH
jgi:hypothetical protein